MRADPIRSTARLALLCFTCVAAGCAGARSVDPPIFSTGAQLPASPAGRVKISVPQVDDPDPLVSAEVNLEQLLAYADRHAPALRVARAQTGRGDAEVAAASPLFQDNPELGFGIGGRTFASSTFVEAGVSLEQTIEVAGERGLRMEAAGRLREVALAEEDESRWAVHVEVHALFLEALVARQRVEAAERVVLFASDLQQVAKRRVDAGDDAPLSMLVAQADLAQARELRVAAHQEEARVRSRLGEAAGWPAQKALQPRGALPAVQAPRSIPVLFQIAAEHHPALRTRALAVAEARTRVRLEDREAWPEPTVGIAYAREGDASDAPQIVLFTAGIPIPLWNRNRGERARASVTLATTKARREAQARRLQAQIARAANAVESTAERVKIFGADVVPAVERNLELIRKAYDLGEIDIHAVSQTRERVLDMQGRAIDARGEYFQALIGLEGLMGTELDNEALLETTP